MTAYWIGRVQVADEAAYGEYAKVLGPVQPDVAASLNNLAGVYVRQDAIAMGPSLLSAVFRMSEDKLGSRSLAAFAALF